MMPCKQEQTARKSLHNVSEYLGNDYDNLQPTLDNIAIAVEALKRSGYDDTNVFDALKDVRSKVINARKSIDSARSIVLTILERDDL